MRIPLIGETNKSRSVNVSASRTVNLVPEINAEGKFTAALFKRPCLASFAQGVGAEVRGMATFANVLPAILGNSFVTVGTDGAVSASYGTIATSSGRVSMEAGKNELGIVDGVSGWTWDGSTLTEITGGSFPIGATQLSILDGYGIAEDPSTPGAFFISDQNDLTTWPGDFGVAERQSDPLLAHLVNDRILWLFGSESTEPFYNSGNSAFPFEPASASLTEWGIAAPFSRAALDGNVLWLGKSKHGTGVVLMARKGELVGNRVSTHAVERAIQGYDTISDAFAYVMHVEGHFWYVLTFPTADATWVFDLVSSVWTEWKSFGEGRFRGNCHAHFSGMHLIGDYADGNIYAADMEGVSDAGRLVECIRDDRHIADPNEHRELVHNLLTLDIEIGVGTIDMTTDPVVVMQYSDDGGHNWSVERPKSLGAIGVRNFTVEWSRLGRSRDRIYRFKITDSVKVAINAAYVWVDIAA